MTHDPDRVELPALGSAAAPAPPARSFCPAGGRPIDPITGECACCSD